MGLFEKKYCDICGGKVGMLTFSKLEDGNICADCKKKLSPFFNERKHSTVSQIKEQLDYREQNRQNLNSFNPTRTFGHNTKVYVDDNQGCFVVSRARDFREENADIITFSQVSGARYEVEEHSSEQYRTDSDGKRVSYNPPRYEYEYDFNIEIDVNSPYFSHIEFELSDSRPDSRYTDAYRRYEQEANELVAAIRGTGMNNGFAGAAMGGAMGMGMNQQGFQQQGFQQQPYQQQGFNQQYQQPMQQGFQQQYQQPHQGFQQQYQQPQQGFQQQYQQPQQGYQQQYQQPQQGYQQQYQQPQQGYQQQYQQPQQGFQQMPYQQPQQTDRMPDQAYNQQPGGWVCPNCGTPCTTKFCQNCGTPKP